MAKVDGRIRNKELKYARFQYNKNYYSSMIMPQEFKRVSSHVSMGLVFYDPNFDFRPGYDPLMQSLERQSTTCMP